MGVRRRGAARAWKCGRKCTGVARLVGRNAGEGAQTGQSLIVRLGATVGLGARGMLIGFHQSLSEPIGINRRDPANFG